MIPACLWRWWFRHLEHVTAWTVGPVTPTPTERAAIEQHIDDENARRGYA